MKKIFEIEMSSAGFWCARNIENCIQTHYKGKVKVREIKQEECNCNYPTGFLGETKCRTCGKPFPPLVNAEIKQEEKPKIEEIAIEQFNQIDCVMSEKQYREMSWLKINELIQALKKVGVLE